MATPNLLSELLARVPQGERVSARRTPADLARLSMETHLRASGDDPRTDESHGYLRLHGQQDEAHEAPLALVGALSTAWQKAVTAVGAALEGSTPARGQFSMDLRQRTLLLLQASPATGSLTLDVRAAVSPMDEVEPDGQPVMFDRPRPLADRASETLIVLCRDLAASSFADAEDLEQELRQRGPRVAAALRALAGTVSSGTLELEASWSEPGEATVVSNWNSTTASVVANFIEMRKLDAATYELAGEAVTVSLRERWLIDEDGGSPVHVSVGDLSDDDARRVQAGDRVRLEIEAISSLSPFSEATVSRRALRLIDVEKRTVDPKLH